MFSRRTEWALSPNRLAMALEAHRRAGRDLLDLTASNPTTIGLRYDVPVILAALVDPSALVYTPDAKGLLSARQAVSGYYRELAQRRANTGTVTVDPEAIILTVSTSEAYSYVFQLLCDPGAEVLVPAPSYPLFEFLAGLQDVRLVPYTLFYDHGWHLDFHSLETALTPRTRAIILVHPNNPTGSYVKQQERNVLNRLCAERELALVVDEVFLDYEICPGPADSDSFAFNQDALTFTLSGISKISGLPQMKLAWIATSGPARVVEAARSRLEVIADTYLSQNAPVQLAAPALLSQRHSIQAQLLGRVRANLRRTGSPAYGTIVVRAPAGGRRVVCDSARAGNAQR